MIVKLDNEFATVGICTELKTLVVRWKSLTNSEQFREVIHFGLDLLPKEDIRHWVGDTTMAKVLPPNEYGYVLKEFVPIGIGRLYSISAIQSRNIFRRSELERFIKEAGVQGIKINLFDSLEEARQWIKNHAPDRPMIETLSTITQT